MVFSLDFTFLVVLVALALAFDYINGFHDAANAIATVVATRVLSPKTAVIYGAVLNFLGALMGTEVAATVGKGMVDQGVITLETVFCTLIGAITWNLITWYKGLPSSSSHALIGSLIGATVGQGWATGLHGWNSVHWNALFGKVVAPMVTSPIMGLSVGFVLMVGITWLVYKISVNKINTVFGRLQIVSAGLMALSHGSNDAQKSMGIIALALATYSAAHGGHAMGSHFEVPLWVIIACAVSMGLGTLSGGWKIIRTIATRMIRLQPVHGFAAETSAFLTIMTASHFGIPLSTTHVISSAIMGVGVTKRVSAVNWSVVGGILWAWVLTIPVSFALSAGLSWVYFSLKHWH
jgi:inorganic phosphate transporter, PiT family